MSLPKITIITPSLNQGPFIEETILSVLSQNYENLEYIIVDGGSNDDTLKIIKKYESELAWWVSEPDKGQANAINKGLEHATGDVFNWLNSDDYLEAGALHEVARIYLEQDADIVCGNCRVFDNQSNETREIYQMKLKDSASNTILDRKINQPSTFYRLSVVKELGCLNESLNFVFDAELWYKYLAKYGIQAVYSSDKILSHFRWHDNSKSGLNEFEPFYEEEKNIHLFLAEQLKLPDYHKDEIFEDLIAPTYSSKEWDLTALDPQIFRIYFNKKYYKSLYYKQRYKEALKCMMELNQAGENSDKNLLIKCRLLPKGTQNSLRGIAHSNHTYLVHNLSRQTNISYRIKSKIMHFVPSQNRVDKTIPLIINNRNRLDFLLRMIEWFQDLDFHNIIIIDNNSGYKPLLDYYRKTKLKVLHLDRNVGHLALWNSHIYERFKDQYYIYTDPDILPVKDCPEDFLLYFYELLLKYKEVQKVGFGLKIDDLPDHYNNKQKVIDWEKQYWEHELEPNIFQAKIDTTFALYRPGAKGGHQLNAIRTGPSYVARHLPWYIDSENPGAEEMYYIKHSSASSSWYKRQNIYKK